MHYLAFSVPGGELSSEHAICSVEACVHHASSAFSYTLITQTACYATGLLLARRTLKKLGLDEIYAGQVCLVSDLFLAIQISVKPRT